MYVMHFYVLDKTIELIAGTEGPSNKTGQMTTKFLGLLWNSKNFPKNCFLNIKIADISIFYYLF